MVKQGKLKQKEMVERKGFSKKSRNIKCATQLPNLPNFLHFHTFATKRKKLERFQRRRRSALGRMAIQQHTILF